jgi:hypothetical protein
VSAGDRQTTTFSGEVRNYGGGGYLIPLRGYIVDLQARLEVLKENNWIDNRTRAAIVEFSVYNAQVYGPCNLINNYTNATCTEERNLVTTNFLR